ncbi:hypothetical protein KTJ16_12490 [Acinetobacter bereziniae]|uniref:hypothetical protein n=1 Tax=Acinetobacter bereziniae TaxID=106648 RepID=UPI0021D14151|nr:hypothetical protein [Acinetobacter bereziniae]MCU4473057.1 hypothetical protein [Acinetobacter bereziniae]MCU4541991.1 hypothetical protein [Acinetobacter bereziniae]
MLLYVIPFVLLLVVAIVLKKREDANKENTNTTSKKTNNKKSSKKNVARTARTSQKQQRTAVVENEVVVQQATKPLSPELKSSIEKLIAAKNYFSAEAKINQALNQDNAQHELYLYLLDVHLAQKDEFAVNQLINHIRSLGLDDIVTQAEEKKKATQTESPIESIAFVPTTPEPAVPEVKNTAAFDALIGNIEATPTPSIETLETPTRNDVETLDFTPSVAQEKSEEKPQAQPLEFNLDSSPQTQPQPQPQPTVEFSFETVKPTTETAKETITPLEFSFTPNEPIVAPVEKPVEIEIAPEFKLDFAEPVATPEKEQTAAPQAFEFKLTPTEAETPVETQPTFVFDQETKSESVEPESVASQLNLEVPSQVEAVTPVETTDPLLTSFPELAQVNEIQLNLDLAQQYIHLGAYASARALLSQDESVYTAEQRQQSQNLLNQIA